MERPDCVIEGKIRKASIILFGFFQVEEITMPAVVEEAANLYLLANPGIKGPEEDAKQVAGQPMSNESSSKFMDVAQVLRKLSDISRGPSNYTVPPIHQLFVFTARKHFNLRFLDSAFKYNNIAKDTAYCRLVEPCLFCEGEQGRDVLTGYDEDSDDEDFD
jgi:hypothetical protein